MFIDPIQAVSGLKEAGKIGVEEKNSQEIKRQEQGVHVPFQSTFEQALSDVKLTDKQVNVDAEMLATGQSDNLHQYMIDIAKAQTSLELLVELRNKALESYSEIMRMNV